MDCVDGHCVCAAQGNNNRQRMIQATPCTCVSDADNVERTRRTTTDTSVGQNATTTTSSENAAQSTVANDNGSYESLAIGLGAVGALLVLIVIALVALFVRTQRARQDGASGLSMSGSSGSSSISPTKRSNEYGSAPNIERELDDHKL